ncbi:MAG: phosphohistidine phosphatase SixA [Thermoanaerobaculum sp.]
MRLFFIRHGDALAANAPYGDAERPLSPQGQEQVRRLAEHLARLGVGFQRVYASPLVRAHETAAALMAAGVAREIETCQALLPEKGLGPLLELVASLTGGDVALVGHEPLLSEAVETLTTGAPRGFLAMKKGACAVVERQEGYWELVALVSPAWLP